MLKKKEDQTLSPKKTKAKAKPEAKAKPKTKVKSKPKTKVKAKPKVKPKAKPKTKTKAKSKPEEKKVFPTPNVGIIGYGYVGKAVEAGFKNVANIFIYDKFQDVGVSLKEVLDKCKIIFIAVPTPMKKSGACDTSIVESVCFEAATLAKKKNGEKIFVVKSTVPPGTCEKISTDIPGQGFHNIIFNPEFLTEKNYINDFLEQKYTVLGKTTSCSQSAVQDVGNIYGIAFAKKGFNVLCVGCSEAEMLKYATNSFLATKVMFFNEMHELCEKEWMNFNLVSNLMKLDSRIGQTHMTVPGPDGQFGFGGKCFPKDIEGLLAFAKKSKTKLPIVEKAQKENLKKREYHDWVDITGATVDNSYDKKGK